MGRIVAVVAIVACAPAPTARVREVTIDIEHSRFVPERIEVEAGTRVRFVVRNGDPIDHEFIVGDRRVQNLHERGTEAHHGAKPGEITVPASTTRATTYEFTAPGSLLFGCHIPGHYAYGMRGVVAVT